MIGARLKYLRKKNKLTQVELGENINVSQSTLALFESEKRDISSDMIIKIANYFDVSTDYLLGLSSTQEAVHHEQLSDDEAKLLNTYRSLGTDEKQIILGKALDLKLSSSVDTHRKKDIG